MTITRFDQSVVMSREKLIIKMRENRAKHIEEFAKAKEDYIKALIVDLEDTLANVKAISAGEEAAKQEFPPRFDAPPQSHEDAYNDVLEMLLMDVRDTIELDTQAFKAYVKDDWEWKSSFSTSNALYASKALTFSAKYGA